jgi:hypothetical protein
MKLWDLIIASAEKAVALQHVNGCMAPGQSGPRGIIETPIRNTAHWLIVFLKAYGLTGNPAYQQAGLRAAAYLMSQEARPMQAAFWCRKDPRKDFSNGLIGQAWVLEALAAASVQLKDEQYGKLAAEVFLLHPFDEKYGLWHSVNVDGSLLPICGTFNQQLWFAASGALILNSGIANGTIKAHVKRFLQTIPCNIYVHRNGLIGHEIFRLKRHEGFWGEFRDIRRTMRGLVKKQHYEQSIGYHSFNLYAWALLKQLGWLSDDSFWMSSNFKKILRYITTPSFRHNVTMNPYAFRYNPTGFEVAFALEAFTDYFRGSATQSVDWVREQIGLHYSFNDNLMCAHSPDPETLSARIYEAVRLSNHELDLAEKKG